MSFTCPTCGAVSHNPNDERELYCCRCHEFQTPETRVPNSRRGLARYLHHRLKNWQETAGKDSDDPNTRWFKHWITLLESDAVIAPDGWKVVKDSEHRFALADARMTDIRPEDRDDVQRSISMEGDGPDRRKPR